jgi:hypothetical protein
LIDTPTKSALSVLLLHWRGVSGRVGPYSGFVLLK